MHLRIVASWSKLSHSIAASCHADHSLRLHSGTLTEQSEAYVKFDSESIEGQSTSISISIVLMFAGRPSRDLLIEKLPEIDSHIRWPQEGGTTPLRALPCSHKPCNALVAMVVQFLGRGPETLLMLNDIDST